MDPDLQARFETAAKDALALPTRPDNETMLRLYALFKQGKSGDAGGSRPGMFDMVGRAKYDAWATLRGTPREEAMRAYIDLVDRLR